jgi:hypothetical protein
MRNAFEVVGRSRVFRVRVCVDVAEHERIVATVALCQEVRERAHLGGKSVRHDDAENPRA